MSLFKFPRPVNRAEIIKPGMPLTVWYSSQKDKPDILFNLSLYDGEGKNKKGLGTIVENGKFVSNAGSGAGFGILPDGGIGFGTPWSAAWRDYVTGYYGVVQAGKAITPPWKDSYVFGQSCDRIAFGLLKTGDPAVLTANRAMIGDLAQMGVGSGFETLLNFDGGGSRALLWLGKWIYTSIRSPYNALAIWMKPETKEDGDTMKVKCAERTRTYTSDGVPESGRWVDKGDVCDLGKDITDNLLVKINYPSGKTIRSAYIRDVGNFIRA